jgi:hypothetical protein
MSAHRILAVALLGGLLGACAPVQWQHASLGMAPSEAEVGECNRSAYLEAERQAFFYGFGYGFARPRYAGRPYYAPWPRYSYGDRFLLERDLFDYCMRAKGYELVPVQQTDRS